MCSQAYRIHGDALLIWSLNFFIKSQNPGSYLHLWSFKWCINHLKHHAKGDEMMVSSSTNGFSVKNNENQ